MRETNLRRIEPRSLARKTRPPGFVTACLGLGRTEIRDHLVQLGPGAKRPGCMGRRTGPAPPGEAAGSREPVAMDLDLQERHARLRKGQVVIPTGTVPQDKISNERSRP